MRQDYGGHSMVTTLRTALLCPPRAAGWARTERAGRWQELGFQHAADFERAQDQHDTLRQLLYRAGVDVIEVPEDAALSLDAVYTHDPSLVSDHGAISLRMGKPSRAGEPEAHRTCFEKLGIPLFGRIVAPGTVEGGDVLWLDARTLLVGRGYRTNAAGIRQLRDLLGPAGIAVIPAPLPHGEGPDVCLHLMSLISLLDEQTALVDLPMLAVETVELLRERGYGLLEMDATERATLGCNVLSLGERRLLALSANPKTNDRLSKAGFEVWIFDGSEIAINGGGGPTCLTRPLLRS